MKLFGKPAAFLLAMAVLIGSVCIGASAVIEPPDLTDMHATAYAIYNIDNDFLLYSEQYETEIAPASTVKILTGIMTFEYFQDRRDEMITVTADSLSGANGNSIGLEVGEIISVDSLLRALIIYNANDAGNVLAYTMSGSVANFVIAMNEKAQQLGCDHSFFVNPSGVDDKEMHTTIHDLIRISTYASKNEEYLDLTSTDYCVLPATNLSEERTINNRNHMVSTFYYTRYFDLNAKGLNAGATEAGGYCLVSLIRRDGISYIVVIMNSEYDKENDRHFCYGDADILLEWAYENYGLVNIVDTTTMVCEIPVELSADTDHMTLLPGKNVELYLPADADIEKDVTVSYDLFSDTMQAPIKQGEIAGVLTAKYKGKLVTTVNLIAKNSVARSELLYYMSILKKIVTSPVFILVLVLAAIAVAAFFAFAAAIREKKRRAALARRRRYVKTVQKTKKGM